MTKIEELENRIKKLENHNINNIIKRVKRLEHDIVLIDKPLENMINSLHEINHHKIDDLKKDINHLMCIIKGGTK
tara:strand:+ start:511 stop:735 length:225 start_codon:yes stop_codon:yes gene_type:complete